MGTFWNKEQFKIVINADNGELPYTVYTDSRLNGADKAVVAYNFEFKDSSSNVLNLFEAASSTAYLDIFDANETLCPVNRQSDYYGKLVPGTSVNIYIAEYIATLEVDEETGEYIDSYDWESYGTWYVTSLTNSFEDGHGREVSIGLEDMLNPILATDISELVYSGTTAYDALTAVISAGILSLLPGATPSSYLTIDADVLAELNNLSYTTLKPYTAASTINDILKLVAACCTVTHAGKIHIRKLIQYAPATADIDFGNKVGALATTITNSVNYGKVTVRSASADNVSYTRIVSNFKPENPLASGSNVITIDLPDDVQTIEAVYVDAQGLADGDEILSVNFTLKQSQLVVTIVTSLTQELLATIDVYGLMPSGQAFEETTVNIGGSTQLAQYSDVYTYSTSSLLNAEERTAVAESLANVIVGLREKVTIRTAMLSPDIEVGDVVTLSDISEIYDGFYRIVTLTIEYSSTYNTTATLLKLNEEEEEE